MRYTCDERRARGSAEGHAMDGDDSFGRRLRRHRRARDLTQEALAQQVFCAVETIKKLEQELRRPSRQMATQLADCLGLAGDERATLLQLARAERGAKRLEVVAEPRTLPPTEPLPLAVPSGTVTFLFSDIEGSTALWEKHPTAMPATLARHDAILRQ